MEYWNGIQNSIFSVFTRLYSYKWNAGIDGDESKHHIRRKRLGYRHVQTFLLFFVTFLAFTMRVNLSLAIVAMTNKNNKLHYDWSIKTQSVVLSSFFWGNVIMMIPSGMLAKRFGGKILVAIAIISNAAVSAIIPISAQIGGWQMVCTCRAMQGLTQALVYPALQQLICQWIPLEEKGLLATIIFAGSQLGIAIQLLLAGFVASAWGWPAIFYINGTTGTVWFIFYMIFGAVSPERCKFISENEVAYIQKSLGRVGEQKRLPTPWREILKTLPFHAALVAHCGYNWGFFTLMTEIPTYMAKVLDVKLSENGLYSAMPYTACYILSFAMGALTDVILKRDLLSVTNTRKLFNTIAFWLPALSLSCLGFVPKGNTALAVTILVITVGLNSAHYVGHMLVHSDMTPNFSAVLFSITSFLANIVSIIAPLVCGIIVQNEKDPKDWQKVFFLASFIYFFSNLIFILFCSAKRQKWNEPNNSK